MTDIYKVQVHETETVKVKVYDGPAGKDSTVPAPPGPRGLPGADSTVPGPRGLPGADSTVPGPRGLPGADSTVPGPPGPVSTVPGPAGPGVPTGGTTGQVLTKSNATNYATAWTTPAAGGGDTWSAWEEIITLSNAADGFAQTAGNSIKIRRNSSGLAYVLVNATPLVLVWKMVMPASMRPVSQAAFLQLSMALPSPAGEQSFLGKWENWSSSFRPAQSFAGRTPGLVTGSGFYLLT